MSTPAGRVRQYLLALQDAICGALERADGVGRFREDHFEEPEGGSARPRVLSEGEAIEKAAVNFSHSIGDTLPEAATARRPELAGRSFQAVSLSMIIHPRNPYAPITHMNLRFFTAEKARKAPVWWFGGGFDLTPCYGFVEDAVHWHRNALAACEPFGEETYTRFKQECDRYFYLPHRGEARGMGGLFFDDLDEWGFERTFEFLRSVGDAFLPGYLPILARRKGMDYGERERDFQLMRRGRYVEFNLLYDRGTRYGLQSGRRIESVLASMPPVVRWRYGWEPDPGSPEARLVEEFLVPRDWLAEAAAGSDPGSPGETE
jgi:coproporphyrinogen III oxidase